MPMGWGRDCPEGRAAPRHQARRRGLPAVSVQAEQWAVRSGRSLRGLVSPHPGDPPTRLGPWAASGHRVSSLVGRGFTGPPPRLPTRAARLPPCLLGAASCPRVLCRGVAGPEPPCVAGASPPIPGRAGRGPRCPEDRAALLGGATRARALCGSGPPSAHRAQQDPSSTFSKIYKRSFCLLQAWVEDCHAVDFTRNAALLARLQDFISSKVTAGGLRPAHSSTTPPGNRQ